MIWLNFKKKMSGSYLHPRYLALRELEYILEIEGPRLEGDLLDVGCGQKPYARLISNNGIYVGIDMPTTMHGLSETDVTGTAMALPFQNEVFDTVLCTEVLEHIPNPNIALQEMHRVTRKGGVLLLTVPLSEQLHEEPYDFYRFTKYGLNYLLNETGWQTEKFYERGGVWLELGYRLSSFLYSAFGARRELSGALQPRLLTGPLVVVLCALIQITATALDKSSHSPLSTIGYGIIARRI
jgi:SAM-dependent methyltransferase